MKKKVIISVSVAMVVLLGLAFAGWAHRYGGPSVEQRIEYVKERLTDRLELDTAQAAALDRMAADLLAEHDQMEARRDEFRDRFFELLNRDRITAEDLTGLFEAKRPHFERMIDLAAENIAEFHALLTPEQRTQLVAEIEQHRQRCRFGRWSSNSPQAEND